MKKEVNAVSGLGKFGTGLLDIGWRLAITVILFLWGGSQLDKMLDTKPLFTVIGFFLVIISFILIVSRIVHQLPREFGGQQDE